MTRLINLGILIAAAIGCGVALAFFRLSGVESPLPVLEIAETDLQRGKLPFQSEYRFSLPIKNHADQAVLVTNVELPCSCSALEQKSFTIPANGEHLLAVTYDGSRLDETNRQLFQFNITFDNPRTGKSQSVGYTVFGQAQYDWKPDRLELDFGTAALCNTTELPTRDVEFSSTIVDLEPRLISGAEPGFVCDLQRLSQQKWRVICRLLPEYRTKPRLYTTVIRLTAVEKNGTERNSQPVTLRAVVQPLISAIPPQINLGLCRVGKTVRDGVTLISTCDRPFKIIAVEGIEAAGAIDAAPQIQARCDFALPIKLLNKQTVKVRVLCEFVDNAEVVEVPLEITFEGDDDHATN